MEANSAVQKNEVVRANKNPNPNPVVAPGGPSEFHGLSMIRET